MATAIDILEFAERFERVGFEHDKARVPAAAFGAAHVTGGDELVTKPYLDTRLAEFEARLLKAITDLGQGLRKDQSDTDVRWTRQIGEMGNNVKGRLWLAVVAVGAFAAAVSAAGTLLLR